MGLSIVRKIILYRFFNWLNLVFRPISTITYTNFEMNYYNIGLSRFIYDNYIDINPSNKIGHLLIQHAWLNIFIIDVKNYGWNFIKSITYKNNTYISEIFGNVCCWKIKGKDSVCINFIDYVLGTNTEKIKDLQFISDSINDYEKDLVSKLLLFKYICEQNYVYVDVSGLILSTYLQLLIWEKID